jgi:hypothetical protein
VRESGENDYYELVCRDCNAQFGFGQKKNGFDLFPKRKNDQGYLPNRGWSKWSGGNEKSEAKVQQAAF